MAGDNHHVLTDPSIERWAAMRENVYQYFKFTRPATNKVVKWGILFPATIAAIAVTYDNKWDWAGKRRGESLLSQPPAQEEQQE